MSFHVAWHMEPALAPGGPDWPGPRGDVPTIQIAGVDLMTPWAISFEAAIHALESLPGMFCEWDGAWIWHPTRASQVEGVLYDRDSRLAYVELKGQCTGAEIDRLREAIHQGNQALVVQLVQEGIVLSWPTWRSAFFA